ncbi:heat stress transcription factor A-4d-like [Dioscorea cayenensis subsp. rotundata]|uniref:Heat stress transcription factor A-4d-like n=1 Tax=Dioscorea cayennensis subsp. rotundata TaxID=55577 RepID=A0AB40AKL1_DIOCR|nr:heat stress transcription factor A-4d-like [Dioscorea cayenensis subsp. rotundata]
MAVSHGASSSPTSSSSSPAPFLMKTYQMVDDPATNTIVSWSSSNISFVVWKLAEFSRDLLPKYFKHNNFSSFVRQLNTYGFHKIDPDRWEFANEEFVRGQRHLLRNIHRRKPIHSHSLHHNTSAPLAEDEKHELEEEIDRLKHDKDILLFELQKHTMQQQGLESIIQVLEERLLILEQRQKDIIAFLAKVVQTPGFVPDLFYQSNLHHKKRRLPRIDYLFEDDKIEEKQIISFQTVRMDQRDIGSMQILDTELFDNVESSISSLEAFFSNVSEASGEDLQNDDRILSQPCALSDEANVNTNMRLLPSELPLPLSLGQSVNHVGNIVDETKLSANHVTGTAIATLPTSVNDVFWEQFLSESPGSSASKDADDKISTEKMIEKTVWCRERNVEHLTEQMGHLSSVERT